MSRTGRQAVASANIEDHLSGILVNCNETRIGGPSTGIEIHVVAQQRDTMQALSAALHLPKGRFNIYRDEFFDEKVNNAKISQF